MGETPGGNEGLSCVYTASGRRLSASCASTGATSRQVGQLSLTTTTMPSVRGSCQPEYEESTGSAPVWEGLFAVMDQPHLAWAVRVIVPGAEPVTAPLAAAMRARACEA